MEVGSGTVLAGLMKRLRPDADRLQRRGQRGRAGRSSRAGAVIKYDHDIASARQARDRDRHQQERRRDRARDRAGAGRSRARMSRWPVTRRWRGRSRGRGNRAQGRQALAAQCDVADAAQVEKFVSAGLDNLGQFGYSSEQRRDDARCLLLRMSEEDWDTVLDSNLKGAFLMTRAALKPMIKQRRGKIVNITRVMGLIANPGQANYSASKAGIIGFTRTVAKEVGSRNIQVNAVAPGFVETAMTETLGEDVKKAIIKDIPAGRLGTPEDVAGAVVFLCSPRSGLYHRADTDRRRRHDYLDHSNRKPEQI